MYTAIHEYAHHLQFTTSATPISVRTHTTAFWNLLHTLLFEAEEKGIYRNPFESIEEFATLTREIREKFLAASGTLMKELGRLLVRGARAVREARDELLRLPRPGARPSADERAASS